MQLKKIEMSWREPVACVLLSFATSICFNKNCPEI